MLATVPVPAPVSADVVRQLDRVDWDFPGSTTPERSAHSLHFFPGNFIPQIPNFLIRILSAEGQTIFDPFCGSGTVGVEALSLNRSVVLADQNRAALQVARGKLGLHAASSWPRAADSILGRVASDFPHRAARRARNYEGTDPELARWVHEETLSELAYLWNLVEDSDPAAHDVLEMLFSDLLFAVASTAGAQTQSGGRRRHHWGWVADNVRPTRPVYHDAIRLFAKRIEKARVAAMATHLGKSRFTLRLEDARAGRQDVASVDAVVTSPPYVGMIDYARASRLTYLWMNWSLELDHNNEIGARSRRKGRNALDDYLIAMDVCLRSISASLRPGGYAAFVVGASRGFPTATTRFTELAQQHLTLVWGPRSRRPSRTRVAERLARASEEWICVLRKE